MLRLKAEQWKTEIVRQLFEVTHLMTWRTCPLICHRANTCTVQKPIFPKSWNIMKSSKIPSKYHLSDKYLAQKQDRISHL